MRRDGGGELEGEGAGWINRGRAECAYDYMLISILQKIA